jgi:bifunctional enzyme CysN/CysC
VKAHSPQERAAISADKQVLRVLICGTDGDGKSTLIARLLDDCGRDGSSPLQPKSDISDLGHLWCRTRASPSSSGERSAPKAPGEGARHCDGLPAAGSQATDLIYRRFATARRRFLVADATGDEQYIGNIAAGAASADLAVLLIDAGGGLITQTRSLSLILTLFGIREIVVVVNKMDTAGWSEAQFERIKEEYLAFAANLGPARIVCIPACALSGDNVSHASPAMPWYRGPTLVERLESVEIASGAPDRAFRMPVQRVDRESAQLPGLGGTIVSGKVRPGDFLAVLPAGASVQVARLAAFGNDLEEAHAPQEVTLTPAEKVEVSPGDLLAARDARPEVADQFCAHLLWLSPQPMLPERSYLMRIGSAAVPAQVTELKHSINVNTFEHVAAKHLDRNEIAVCNFALDRAIAFDPYAQDRETGGFILLDRMTNAIIARGTIDFALRRAANIHWQALQIDKRARSGIKAQRPCALWLTGLSGAGKSTVADLVEQSLHCAGHHTMLLDGDNVRHGLNRDLGFTDEDRVENVRRVAEVAKLMVDAGLIVLVSFISPFRSERRMARALFGADEFIEIFVDAPLDVCEARDPKGLYKLARAGKLPNFTGIGSAYEPPEQAELVLAAGKEPPQVLADRVLATLQQRGVI